jgi:hypothetical protein
LVKFIHRYFILFDIIVNGKAFLISFLDNLFLVDRNATDFLSLSLFLSLSFFFFSCDSGLPAEGKVPSSAVPWEPGLPPSSAPDRQSRAQTP